MNKVGVVRIDRAYRPHIRAAPAKGCVVWPALAAISIVLVLFANLVRAANANWKRLFKISERVDGADVLRAKLPLRIFESAANPYLVTRK